MARKRREEDAEDTIVLSEMTTDPERFYMNVRKLALIVLHMHYSFVRDRDMQEDLIQEAICKAYDLLKSGEFDSSKSSIRNYLYTGMRNEMQNHYYRNSKEVVVSEFWYKEEYEAEDTSGQEENIIIPLDEDIVFDVCDNFFEMGNYHNPLIKELLSIGIKGDLVDMDEPEEVNPRILEACFIEYVWRCNRG